MLVVGTRLETGTGQIQRKTGRADAYPPLASAHFSPAWIAPSLQHCDTNTRHAQENMTIGDGIALGSLSFAMFGFLAVAIAGWPGRRG